MGTKTIVVISDLHSGHKAGLTPPSWNDKPANEKNDRKMSYFEARSVLFDLYLQGLKSIGKIDALVVNGDAIDGQGKRSSSTELLTVDRMEQASMAAECIRCAKAEKVYLTNGTAYHTSAEGEDFESVVAAEIPTDKYRPEIEVKQHLTLKVNGVVFDIKHHCGSSGIPHGRHTATSREALWNTLWSERGITERADILIRSHVHYFQYAGTPDRLYMTTPALQGLGSTYGVRRCSGLVDWGFVWFKVHESGNYSWDAYVPQLANDAQKARTIEV